MNSRRMFPALVVAGALAFLGCGDKLHRILQPNSATQVHAPGDNIPPTVRITCPGPLAAYTGDLISPIPSIRVPAVLRIFWHGEDLDGSTGHPVRYKFIVLNRASEFPSTLAVQDPDSLRRYYMMHPLGPWAGWDSTSHDSATVRFTVASINDYVFAVVAIDERGGSSPTIRFGENIFWAGVSTLLGPRLIVGGDSFEYAYPSAGLWPSRQVPVEVAADAPFTVRWRANAGFGSCLSRTRWVLDPASLDDPTPRSGPGDFHHWSDWGDSAGSAILSPFTSSLPPKRDVHRLYVEGDDGYGLSRATVNLVVVPRQFRKDLLIIDDTRLPPDMMSGGELLPPSGRWPTAAELDTFLFARGGFPWRGYPSGTLSSAGVFAGYSFDTLGTRRLQTGFVPLSTLAQYRYVVWMVDYRGAKNPKPPWSPSDPQSAMTWMMQPGQTPSLSAYVRMGGKLWLLGGNAGLAASLGFNDINNDRLPVNPTITLSSVFSSRELGPGRFMYDIAKWQSEFRVSKPNVVITKSIGRLTDSGAYPGLPEALEPKASATDPIAIEAPGRTASDFYLTNTDIEFLQVVPNRILEDIDPDPLVTDVQSTLDTLYRVRADILPDAEPDPARSPRFPIMTYYHGGGASVVHSGFGIWFFKRSQCTQLVDFVLHDLWGLSRTMAPTAAIEDRR